ncbi:DUF563 domain-containing protein [Roseovarius sp. EL26]|uniref:glycosyltransferase family 61 protein n=1 Tax=Roseovarius sp. EL26 TaxID=2126672 RepID=UPI000EA3F94C|nr:glycosyltransferase family 61 protein [Roseovarius sp. EL26]
MSAPALPPSLDFDSNQPLKGQIQVLKDAVVMSWAEGSARGASRPGGVYTASGEWSDVASLWRNPNHRIMLPAHLPNEDEIETLRGTWMFGGMMYGHFGHFLCESTSRLWGLAHSPLPLDGIIYIPKKKMTWPKRLLHGHEGFFDALGVSDLSFMLSNAPLRVEHLVIPPQGFGMHAMIAGAPEYRDFIHANLGKNISPEGSKMLYISRSRLFVKRGSILGEAQLEQHLAAEGYEIFHPQEHPIEVQIARYKAAQKIISLDGSALHLAAFFANKNSCIAILNRRPGTLISDFKTQLEKFADVTPLLINEVHRFWGINGKTQHNELYSLMSFPCIQKNLKQNGFISGGDTWANLNSVELAQALADIDKRLEGTSALEEVFVR